MKKSYKILLLLIVIVLFLYSIFLALTSKKPITLPPAGQSLSLPGRGGRLVQVKDFTRHPQQILGDVDVIAQTDKYSIVYFTRDQSFLVTVLAEPVRQNRLLAEQALLDNLQIQSSDACQLTVALTVPADVNEQLSGQDYGLSFCPSGKTF